MWVLPEPKEKPNATLKMKQKGFGGEAIAELTGLSYEEIERLD